MPSSCVWLPVCVFVTLRYCIKTAKRRIPQIVPHDSSVTLVFWHQISLLYPVTLLTLLRCWWHSVTPNPPNQPSFCIFRHLSYLCSGWALRFQIWYSGWSSPPRTNRPWKGRGLDHVTLFACTSVDLEKIFNCMPLPTINNAVDDGPVFVAHWAVDASAAIH